VLWGTIPCYHAADDIPVEVPDWVAGLPDAWAEAWGSGLVIGGLTRQHPELSPAEQEQLLSEAARFERNWATPNAVRQLMAMNLEIDCRQVLPTISVPTLVVARKDDPWVPALGSRWMAKRIPGAKYVELPGDFHFGALPGDDDDVLDEVEEFLTGTKHGSRSHDRVLKTVVFTDIVGSTQRAQQLGDHKWRRLLDSTDQVVEDEVSRHGGQLVKSTGDGHLATFDGPARAVRCATALQQGVRRLGLGMRAGLHTGEVELRGADVGGIAVHIGARVADLARADEVLCSRTVVDLVAGSGLEFEDRGAHELRGVAGSWQLYAALSS
jgi:class 3 adenylate cyclase